MKTEVIVALDVANSNELSRKLSELPEKISWFKVGLELFCAEGPQVLTPLHERNGNIFLDLKLHDIPRTVEKAVISAAKHNVDLLTIHASGGEEMMKAAVNAAKSANTKRPLKLLAVTVLTSLNVADLNRMGIPRTPAEHALALAEMACINGVDGVVCSLHEANIIRKTVGPSPLIVTPGIRLPGDSAGDQKRIGTPYDAREAGATHIVVGRPILDSSDPGAAYDKIIADLQR
ncbi:MAG TPA: orotidine-5'-phosphate decarboxylase [Kiritimatiellia bacterium]|nr:orotidine-5'-phosphate decarboxylase [Kiritimatiellia bacterium]